MQVKPGRDLRGNRGGSRLVELEDELRSYPGDTDPTVRAADVALPMRLRHGAHELSMFTIAAAVETAADVTVQELVIESFYPSDERTAALLRGMS